MSLLWLAGSGYNQVGRAAVVPVPGSVLSGYSAAALYNGLCDQAFIFDGPPYTLDFDLNQVTNPGFETAFVGGLPAAATAAGSWGKSSGATLTRDTSSFLGGAASMRVDGADQYGYFDQVVSAGEYLTVRAAGMAPTLSVPYALIGCQNVETGSWLNSAYQWQSAQAYWYSGGSSFATAGSLFQVESYAACRVDRPTLRWRFVCASPATQAWFDDFYVWPRVNFGFIHNHNFPAAVGLGLRSGAAGFATTLLRGTFSITQPTMFVTMSDVDDRYWRLISTTPPDDRNLYLWQLVLGQYRTARRRQNYGQTVRTISAQDRSTRQAYLREAHERRPVELDFRYNDADDYAERAEILGRSRNGAYPLVVVPETADPASAMYCRTPPELDHTRVTLAIRDGRLPLEEFPFGIVAP